MSEATATKSHDSDYLEASKDSNNGPANILARMGKAHEDSTLHKEIQETKECWEWETNLPQGIVHQLGIQNKMVAPENIHTNNIIQAEQVGFTYLEIQTHTYVYVSRNMYVYIHM